MIEKLETINITSEELHDALAEIEDCLKKSIEIVDTIDNDLFTHTPVTAQETMLHEHTSNRINIVQDYLWKANKIIEGGVEA